MVLLKIDYWGSDTVGKIVIIGSGGVGAAIGYSLTYINGVKEVVLVDINEELTKGEVLDIYHGISDISTTFVHEGTYDDCWDSDIIIITAGRNRKPGQSRKDLLEENQKIMQNVLDNIYPFYNNSFIIIVSNPVDLLTEYVIKQGFIHKEKICGTGCMLDTSRWISQIAQYLSVETSRVEGFAVGEHGENQHMLWDMVKVDGMPIEEFCKKNSLEWNVEIQTDMHTKVKEMGAEIIKRKGRTQYGIATVVAYLVKCLIRKEQTLVSVGLPDAKSGGRVFSQLAYIGNQKVKIWTEGQS